MPWLELGNNLTRAGRALEQRFGFTMTGREGPEVTLTRGTWRVRAWAGFLSPRRLRRHLPTEFICLHAVGGALRAQGRRDHLAAHPHRSEAVHREAENRYGPDTLRQRSPPPLSGSAVSGVSAR